MESESPHDFWMRMLGEMGGLGVFAKALEPLEPLADYPMMLTQKVMDSVSGKIVNREMIVYDETERDSALKLGFENANLGVVKEVENGKKARK